MSVTITSTSGVLRCANRLYAGDLARIVITGSDVSKAPDRLIVLSPRRDPIAACSDFVAMSGQSATWVGYLSLRTQAVADLIADIPAGRAIACAVCLYRDTAIVSGGVLPVVASAMPDQLEVVDPGLGEIVYVADLRKLIIAGKDIDIEYVDGKLKISSTAQGGSGNGIAPETAQKLLNDLSGSRMTVNQIKQALVNFANEFLE